MYLFLCILIGKLITLAIGMYYFKCLPNPYKWVFFLTAIALFCECVGYYLGVRLHKPNAWLFNIYLLFDIWMMGTAAIYLMNFKKNVYFFVALLGYTIVWVISVAINSINTFANFAMVFGLILLTIMYLLVLFNNSVFKKSNILTQPVFWLSLSTILYCSCDIPYFGLHNYLIIHAPRLSYKLIGINTVLDVIRYPLVAISFILLGRQRQIVLKAA